MKKEILILLTACFLVSTCANEKPPVQKSFKVLPGTGHWPAFRGENARGVADSMDLPLHWDAKNGQKIKWKTMIPGLAHSSPVIWEDKLFVTTAVSSQGNENFNS